MRRAEWPHNKREEDGTPIVTCTQIGVDHEETKKLSEWLNDGEKGEQDINADKEIVNQGA